VRAWARGIACLPACLPPAMTNTSRRAAAVRRRFAALDARLAASVEREDRRVQALTEALLYTLLPAALAAVAGPADDLAAGLRLERCRVRRPRRPQLMCAAGAGVTRARRAQAVAGAALAAAALLNLPPWLLEFLLCLPWARLADLYRSSAGAGIGWPSYRIG